MKKLVLQGAALPSTDGHILKIADYVEKLETEKRFNFMADFRDITFQGAAIDATETDPVIRFSLAAWYDEAKRVENRDRGPSSGGTANVGDVQRINRDRTQELESLTPGLAR